MDQQLRVAVLQTPGGLADPPSRMAWLYRATSALDTGSIDLLVLPELFLTGYHIGERVQQWAEAREGSGSRQIAALARQLQTAIVFGYAERDNYTIFNSAACYDKTGTLACHHRKLVLPPGFERDQFTPGSDYSRFSLGAFTIAMLVCYDAEFPEAFREVSLAGADVVVVPTALTANWGVVSERLIPTRAFENGVFVCYANHSGEEHGLSYYGGSCIVGPDGEDLARAGATDACLQARLNLAGVAAAKERLPYHVDRLKLPVSAEMDQSAVQSR